VIHWETTLASCLQRQWKRYRQALKRCQRDFSEEAVHESRVETRRLMAQLELLGVLAEAREFKRARRALKEHLECFNPLRDTQVQLLVLDQQADAFPDAAALRVALRAREKRCLIDASKQIRDVDTGRVKQLIAGLLREMEAAGASPERRTLARRAILRAVDNAFELVAERRKQMDPGQAATIHRTRVAFKTFRYMVEALQPLLPEISHARLEAMQAFQTLLGDLQDSDVFLERVDKFNRKAPARAKSLAAFRHWLLRRRTQQIDLCMRHADALLDFWHPRRPVKLRKKG
jgi:CHAD domain-containing protein